MLVARTNGQWSVEFTQRLAFFGYSVAATDCNQDGWPDLFVGARSYDGLEKDCGGVFQFIGSTEGLKPAPLPPLWVPQEGALFGGALAAVGDVTGDHFPDLLAGVSHFRNPRDREGAAFFYSGGAMPLAQTNNTGIIWGVRPAATMGTSVGAAGDVNGDGFQDVIAGAPRHRQNHRAEGGAVVHLGSSKGLSAKWALLVFGEQAEVLLGSAVAGAGDVNGDGYDDVLIGAPQFSTKYYHAGRAFLHLGSSNGPVQEPSWFADGPEARILFGSAFCALGDLDGDGFDDFAVSAPGYEKRLDWPGKVFMYFGSAKGPGVSPRWVFSGEQRSEQFGDAIALAGDVNGDGLTDLLVGAPFHQAARAEEGRVYLYPGRRGGFEDSPAWVADGGQHRCRYGWALAGGVDFNRDGLADFVVGSPYYNTDTEGGGRVDVFFGSRTNYQPVLVVAATAPMAAAPSAAPASEPTRRLWLWTALALLGLLGALLWRHPKQKARAAAVAAQRERERIARDLHDGLGADLARLALLRAPGTENRNAEAAAPETHSVPSANAADMLHAMQELVWSVHPAHDTLESLVTFLSQYAERLFAGTSIRYLCDLPITLPDLPLSPEVRNNVFLAVKEALANALKHSGAGEVWLRVRWEPPRLTIITQDNGRGFLPLRPAGGEGRGEVGDENPDSEPQSPPLGSGNGLRNIQQRLEELKGSATVESQPGRGTRVILQMNLQR
jgi:signal transduction histidine kinase